MYAHRYLSLSMLMLVISVIGLCLWLLMLIVLPNDVYQRKQGKLYASTNEFTK